jgi:hypothetical protein
MPTGRLLRGFERVADGLRPLRGLQAFAIAGGLLGAGLLGMLDRPVAMATALVVTLWGVLLEVTCETFTTDGGRRPSRAARAGPWRGRALVLGFAVLYLFLGALSGALYLRPGPGVIDREAMSGSP